MIMEVQTYNFNQTESLIRYIARDYVIGHRKLCVTDISATTEIKTESSEIELLYLHWKMNVKVLLAQKQVKNVPQLDTMPYLNM